MLSSASKFRLLWWLLVLVAMIGYVWLGVSRIRFDVDLTRMLPRGSPEAEGARLFMRHFLKHDQVLMVLEGESAEDAEIAAAIVAQALEQSKEEVKQVVWQQASGGIEGWAELLAWAWLNRSPSDWATQMNRLSRENVEETLAEAVEELATAPLLGEGLAGYDPLGLAVPFLADASSFDGESEFASADGRFRVVYVELQETDGDYRRVAHILAKLRAVVDEAANGKVRVQMTGEPAFLAEISSSMEGDMKRSALTTLLLTTLLVWLVFRRFRLLPLLAMCLGLVFVMTLATCGLLLGSITALTVGFGAILIGLSADYGVLVFRSHLRHPGDPKAALLAVRGGVLWAMSTTAAVFSALLVLGFPGLAELGWLVAIGVVIGALVMLGLLPKLLSRWMPGTVGVSGSPLPGKGWRVGTAVAVFILGGCASGLLWRGLPVADAAAGSIRPRGSEAYEAIERLEERLGGGETALSVVVTGEDLTTVGHRLHAAKAWLEGAREDGQVETFSLPLGLWPMPELQATAMEQQVPELLANEELLREAVDAAGFSEDAWGLTQAVFEHWRHWIETGVPHLPESAAARWTLERLISLSEEGEAAALGVMRLTDHVHLKAMMEQLPEGCSLAGGALLNQALDRYLQQGFVGISLLFAGITLTLLAIALRAWRPFLWVALCLALSYAALLGMMSWLDLRWHAFTLPALLLSLGTGSDYFIHLILRLEKEGSVVIARAELAPALVVCAGSSILGFGSLATASSSGLASMGIVCAAALGLNLLSALFVMPWLWSLGRTGGTPVT